MLIVNSPTSINVSLYTHLINYTFSFISYFISKTLWYFGPSCMSYQNIMFMHIYCHVTGDFTMDIQNLCFKSTVYLLHSNQSNHYWIKTFYFLLPHTRKSSINIRWTASFRKWHILTSTLNWLYTKHYKINIFKHKSQLHKVRTTISWCTLQFICNT